MVMARWAEPKTLYELLENSKTTSYIVFDWNVPEKTPRELHSQASDWLTWLGKQTLHLRDKELT